MSNAYIIFIASLAAVALIVFVERVIPKFAKNTPRPTTSPDLLLDLVNTDLSSRTIKRLKRAGWNPDRDVLPDLQLPGGINLFDAAAKVLSRFAGLRFGTDNEHVVLDPIAAIEHDGSALQRCQTAVGKTLYPVGFQEHQDREPIFVDESGSTYINSGDDLYLLAPSFEGALAYLTLSGSTRDCDRTLNGANLQHWSLAADDTA